MGLAVAVAVASAGRLDVAVVPVGDLGLEGSKDVVRSARVVPQVLGEVADRLAVAVERVVPDRAPIRPVVEHLLPAGGPGGARSGRAHSQQHAYSDGGEEKAHGRWAAVAHALLGRDDLRGVCPSGLSRW